MGRPALTAGQLLAAMLAALRRRWWVAALVAILAFGAAFALTDRDTRYSADAGLARNLAPPVGVVARAEVRLGPAPTIEAAIGDEVLERLSRRLGSERSPAAWRRRLSAETPLVAGVVLLTAVEADEERAIDTVNAWAGEVVALRRREVGREVRAAIRRLQRRERNARAGGLERLARRLRATRRSLERRGPALPADVNVAQATGASRIGTPVWLLALGAVLSGLVGAAALTLAERRLLTADLASAALGLPVLAVRDRGSSDADVAATLRFATAGADGVLVTPLTDRSAHAAEADAGLLEAGEAGAPLAPGGEVLFAIAQAPAWVVSVDVRRDRLPDAQAAARTIALAGREPAGLVVHDR